MPQVKVRKGADPSFQYYYKCRTKGCCFNKNVKDIHGKFEAMLADITIKPELIDPLLFQLEKTFDDLNVENKGKEKHLKEQLTELRKKVDILEEKYFMGGEMSKETYDKFAARYKAEQVEITTQIENCSSASSNHKSTIKKALDFCSNLLNIWKMGTVGVKEKLQKLLFPEGLAYDKEIGAFRTNTINSLIAVIVRLSGDSLLVETKWLSFLRANHVQRRKRDSNPRKFDLQQFSRLPQSTTLPFLRGQK